MLHVVSLEGKQVDATVAAHCGVGPARGGGRGEGAHSFFSLKGHV